MLPLDTVFGFLAVSVLLALAPGPDNLFVLTQSVLHGVRAGFVVTAGICTGLLVHSSAVAFGVAAIIRASAPAFAALKFLGAGYLLYLAWRAFRAGAAELSGNGQREALGTLYRRGILMNVTNPKVSIFFLAFLPQFADPENGSVTVQVLLLGGLFILASLIVFGGLSLAAGILSLRFPGAGRGQRTLNWIAGIVFVGIALKLVMPGS